MSPRPADPELKPRLMHIAEELMLEGSFRSMSLRELCSLAAVSRGAFFHYFPSKVALALAVLKDWIDRFTEAQIQAPYQKLKDPKARLFGAIDFIVTLRASSSTRNACLVGNLTQELAGSHPEIRELCAASFRALTAYIRKLIDDANSQTINSLALAEHFSATLQGAIILAKALEDPSRIRAHIEIYKDVLAAALEAHAPQKSRSTSKNSGPRG